MFSDRESARHSRKRKQAHLNEFEGQAEYRVRDMGMRMFSWVLALTVLFCMPLSDGYTYEQDEIKSNRIKLDKDIKKKMEEKIEEEEEKRKMEEERKKMEEQFEDDQRKMDMIVAFKDEMEGGKKAKSLRR
ncbi:hypothetical protein Cni_G06458 [Canna indica]|uniref:Uncharacterized protein n=1 Tax=Canna indica TaxID=4628 RepID=A0AAQ3Q5Y6_9LILI|nr:hypothetical protein Cni_G06458 [Canna indica]